MKKITFLIVLMFSTLVFLNSNSFAQGVNLHGGIAKPTSDWGDDDYEDDDSGLQGTGLNVGIEGIIPVTDKGLGIFLGADLNFTSLKKDVRDDIEEEIENYLGNPDITFYKTFNIPISGGLHYKYAPNEKFALYGKGGIAASLVKMTNFIIEDNDPDYTSTTKFDLATGLGVVLGGGIILNEKLILGINYFGLGQHTFKGEQEIESSGGSQSEDIEKFKQKVSYVTVTIGTKF
jgi:opacity protein-like surface antigen